MSGKEGVFTESILPKSKDLIHCPFCGSNNVELKEKGDSDGKVTIPYHIVQCNFCQAAGPQFSEYNWRSSEAKMRAVACWNRRTNFK